VGRVHEAKMCPVLLKNNTVERQTALALKIVGIIEKNEYLKIMATEYIITREM